MSRSTNRASLSLRDLFYLTLLVALGIGWLSDVGYAVSAIGDLSDRRWSDPGPPGPPSATRTLATASVQLLSNAELEAAVLKAAAAAYDPDVLLTECLRRKLNGPVKSHCEQLRTDKTKSNVASLITLRRLEGKPDPLEIALEFTDRNCENLFTDVANLRVRLKNVDSGGENVRFLRRDNEQCGLNGYWRVELTAADGRKAAAADMDLRELFTSETPPPSSGDTYAAEEVVEPGQFERQTYQLDPRKYVNPPPDGRYSLQVIYCDNHFIAFDSDLSDRIVLRSKSVDVVVTNRTPNFFIFSQTPKFALGFAAFVITAGLALGRLRKAPVLRLRDAIGLGLIVLVCCGWLAQQQAWRYQIQRVVPASEAEWTMQPTDPPR